MQPCARPTRLGHDACYASSMRFSPGRRSSNLEDRRAQGGGGGFGLFSLLPLFARFGIPGLLVFGGLLFFSGTSLFGGGSDLQQPPAARDGVSASQDPEAPLVDLVSFVLDDVQSTWSDEFAKQ